MSHSTAPRDVNRIKNALWGLFIGDALAMPVHWYYSVDNIKKDFGASGVQGFNDAKHPHPESFMVGMSYEPNVKNAQRLGRKFDILGPHSRRFYHTSYSELEIKLAERESEHGNATPSADDRYHYHHGLKAGDNTLAADLSRVLLRNVTSGQNNHYDQDAWLKSFVDFMTSNKTKDSYSEIYVRRWFENYSEGIPAHACADYQRRVWSIGSMGGVIRPLLLSMIAKTPYQAVGLAIEHQNCTHRSENVSSALATLVPLIHQLIRKEDTTSSFNTTISNVRIPKINGEDMFKMYRDYQGPGNIPKDLCWKLHTEFREDPAELQRLIDEKSVDEVVRGEIGTACYTEQGVPLMLYLAAKNKFDFRASLLANANAGGDNVHRGAVMGLILGAATDEIPEDLKKGLSNYADLEKEINAFAEAALADNAF